MTTYLELKHSRSEPLSLSVNMCSAWSLIRKQLSSRIMLCQVSNSS